MIYQKVYGYQVISKVLEIEAETVSGTVSEHYTEQHQ